MLLILKHKKMNISNEAIKALKNQLTPEQQKNQIIRFFATQGCCGPSIQMSVVNDTQETDESFSKDDIRFGIDQDVREMLQNVTLVFTDRGFKLEGFQSTGCC